MPIGELRVSDELRRRLESATHGDRRDVMTGIRPEHFEDASLVALPARDHVFATKIDVLEKLGPTTTRTSPRIRSGSCRASLPSRRLDPDPSCVPPSADDGHRVLIDRLWPRHPFEGGCASRRVGARAGAEPRVAQLVRA